ncbi:MAG: hypothetical protein J6B28_07735 [Eubacterium sp.]|nr:hypothetical protein [Eubacterium sp.]
MVKKMNTWKHIKQTKLYQNRKWHWTLTALVLFFIFCIPVVTGDEVRTEPKALEEPEQTLQNQQASDTQTEQTKQTRDTAYDSTTREAGYIYEANSKMPEEPTYVLTVSNGYLQVHELPGGKLYMETGILYRLLPEKLQLEILEGKFFDSEEAVLLFLESYTS